MAKWFRRRIESLLDNLIASALVAGGVTVWAAIKSLPVQEMVVLFIFIFIAILVVIRLIVMFKFKPKQQEKESNEPRTALKIGAKAEHIKTYDYAETFGGGSESEGDKQVTVDVILALTQPMTLDIVALELWGKRFEAKIQSDVAPFDLIKLTPLTLPDTHTYTLVFDVPKESAVDTKEARIYALSGNLLEWFSKPFVITFGGSK